MAPSSMTDNTQSPPPSATATQPTQFADLAADILRSAPLLAVKLARALFTPVSNSERALTEVIKFLTLAAESTQGPLTPSARVDVAWHEFILFTRTYANFCDQQFGNLVHHEPSSNHEINTNQYAETLKRYRERFGDPPTDFWGGAKVANPSGASASCGNCESDL